MAIFNSATLTGAAVGGLFLYLLWRTVLSPRFASPLRGIPMVKVDWRTALYRWIYVEPTPDQILGWLEQTPLAAKEQGFIRYPGVGGAERVLLLRPEALREVLVTQAYSGFQKPALNRQRLAMFGNGLLVADLEEHRAQKKKMLPAFAPRHIRALGPLFWTKACELVDVLEKETQELVDVELAQWTSRASLDIIGVAAWGKDFGALENPHTEVVSKYHRMFRGTPRANQQAKLVYAVGLMVQLSTLKRFFPCEFFANLTEGTRAIHRAAATTIAERREKPSTAVHPDILTHAMSTGLFDDAALAGQMLNILAAGHETSSLAVTWSCYLLAKHPDVQAHLRAEVRASLPSPTDTAAAETVLADTLESLPYLSAVLREALRIIPPAPVVRRSAFQNTSILGHPIPAGTAIIGLYKYFNTLPEIWGPNAQDFHPDRWLDAEEHAVDNLFTTFNIGPRSCIGEGFARLEIAALLAAIVGRFKVTLASPEAEPDTVYGITVKPISLHFHLQRQEEGW